MSGIAIAAPTTPGSVETFCSCSSERSPEISARISSSAKIRAGTRMSARDDAGISHMVSSMRIGWRSDIEHDPAAPGPVLRAEAKPVQRNAFHERPGLSSTGVQEPAERGARERQVGALGNEPLGLGEEHELVEPGREEGGEVGRLDRDPTLDGLAGSHSHELGKGP